jgi:hypothetical protein
LDIVRSFTRLSPGCVHEELAMASHASHSQLSLPGDGPSAGLGSSLAFLGIGYVLILAAPLLSSHFQAILSQGPALGQGSGMLPAAAAAGIALVGAGAMMLVLSRLVRDVESRPYASIAPVLTVFTGFVLMGLRARLPFEGLASQHLGVLALSLSLCGGALICRERLFVQAMGWLVTLLPPVVVAYALAAVSGSDIDVFAALRRADSQVRVYVVLMSLSAVALGLVATAARIVSSGRASVAKPALDVPMPRLLPAPAAQPVHAPQRVHTPAYHVGEPPGGYQASYALAQAPAYAPSPLLGLEEDDPIAPPRSRKGLMAAVSLAVVGAGALAAYQLVLVPRQQAADQAAIKAADAQGAEQRAQAEAERAKESEAARAQLEALVAAGEARAAAPVTPAAEATPPVQAEAPAAAQPAAALAQPAAAQPTAAPALSAPAVAHAAPAVPAEARAEAPRSAAPAKAAAKARLAKAAKTASLKRAKLEKAAQLAAAPKAEAEPVAQAVKPEAPKAEAQRTAPSKPAKAVKPEPPESTNSADLDLDQLVNKALKHKGASSVSASDDPLVGL